LEYPKEIEEINLIISFQEDYQKIIQNVDLIHHFIIQI
jgi:hypothetical protein